MAEKNKQKPVIIILKERKIMGVTKNDAFFEYVDLAHEKFMGKDNEKVYKFIYSIEGLESFERNRLWRDLAFMSASNYEGIISVDWEAFFKLPKRTLIQAARDTAKRVSELYPNLPAKWDALKTKHDKEPFEK